MIAVQAAMVAAALQNLSWLSGAENWVHGAANTVEHTFSSGFDTFKTDAAAEAKKLGPDFKIAAVDMEWAAGKAW